MGNIQRTDYIFMIELQVLSASGFGATGKQKIIQISQKSIITVLGVVYVFGYAPWKTL